MSQHPDSAVLARLDAIQQDLAEIKAQVKVTNGRVSNLELWRARLEGMAAAGKWVPPVVSAVVTAGILAALSPVL